MSRWITVAGLLALAAPAMAQRGPAPYYEDTNNIPASPEIHLHTDKANVEQCVASIIGYLRHAGRLV